jgi:hypothetical protein
VNLDKYLILHDYRRKYFDSVGLAEGQTSRQSFPQCTLTARIRAAARELVAAQAGSP